MGLNRVEFSALSCDVFTLMVFYLDLNVLVMGVILGYILSSYADDIVLLAPTVDALRRMLKICDNYASKFNIVFNAKQSKCLIA